MATWCAGAAQAQPTFTRLGDLPGGSQFSIARAVNAHGTVVVGDAVADAGHFAFRWTAAAGMQSLGDLPGGDALSNALGVSHDGSVVAGNGESTSGTQAFRWTPDNGMVGLGSEPGYESYGWGLSGDGAVVVGQNAGAARWTIATGWRSLGAIPGTNGGGFALAATFDGSVIVGATDGRTLYEAFRWTPAGMMGIGGPGFGSNQALAVNTDGSVIVGRAITQASGSNFEAFVWTAETGMRGMGDLPGGAFSSQANGVSADGSVIVGFGTIGQFTRRAFFYTPSLGMVDLKQWLIDHGISELSAWRSFDEATAVSADGTVIVGHGWPPDRGREAWLVRLGPVCPPDVNHDLTLNSQDFFDFLTQFFEGRADFNGDGATTSQDFFDFLEAFFRGCP